MALFAHGVRLPNRGTVPGIRLTEVLCTSKLHRDFFPHWHMFLGIFLLRWGVCFVKSRSPAPQSLPILMYFVHTQYPYVINLLHYPRKSLFDKLLIKLLENLETFSSHPLSNVLPIIFDIVLLTSHTQLSTDSQSTCTVHRKLPAALPSKATVMTPLLFPLNSLYYWYQEGLPSEPWTWLTYNDSITTEVHSGILRNFFLLNPVWSLWRQSE